jgi:hypothetical protein
MMAMCGFGRSDVVSFLFSFSENKKFVLQNHKTLCLMLFIPLRAEQVSKANLRSE